jgi:hypothetical protein
MSTTTNYNFDLLEEDGSEVEPEKTHNDGMKAVDAQLKNMQIAVDASVINAAAQATAIAYKGHSRINDESWVVGTTGSQGAFTVNGDLAENKVVQALAANGFAKKVWQCIPDSTINADGGWGLTATHADTNDHNKKWLYGVYIKTSSHSGATYLGCGGGISNLISGGGAANGNPYFYGGGDLPQLNKWYLVVGLVHEYNYTGGDLDVSGIYDPETGERVVDAGEFRFTSSTGSQVHRSYHYYNSAGNSSTVHQEMHTPFLIPFDEVSSIQKDFCFVDDVLTLTNTLIDPTTGCYAPI